MYPDALLQLICLFTVGVSLLLAGAVNALLRSAHTLTRVVIALIPVTAALFACWSFTNSIGLVVQTGLVLALVLIPSLAFGSERILAYGTWVLQSLRRPAVRWCLVSVAGLMIALGALVAYDRQDEGQIDAQMREISELESAPPLKTASRGRAVTDRGNRVILQEPSDPLSTAELNNRERRVLKSTLDQSQVIRHESASEHTNCHGWVFSGGRYWIGGTEVESILNENEYKIVENPKPGDLVIYRDAAGVSHSGIVRYVTEGLPVMVEGKWGVTSVYLHAVDQSCYGMNFSYYRSPRNGHLLAGLSESHDNVPQATLATD
jgi:hypothetical protein